MTETTFTHPTDRRIELRVKIKSLAEESRIIRLEEKRLPGPCFKRACLRQHRIEDVRQAARASQLAYAFLRGRTYRSVEVTTREPLTVTKQLLKNVKDFGGDESKVCEWLSELPQVVLEV